MPDNEKRLAEALVVAADRGVDAAEVFEQIPEAQRPKVRAVLSGLIAHKVPTVQKPQAPAIIIAQPKEVRDLVESLRLEEGYTEELERQKFYQLLKAGEKAPDFGQVLKTFTPKMLAAAQGFQTPKLTMTTKNRSFNNLIDAMNAHKTMPNQIDAYVDRTYRQHGSQTPENWGAHILEDPLNVDIREFDDINLTLGKRLKRFAEYKESAKVGGMNRIKYTHAMMQALKNGQSIDDELWTMLDEDPALLMGSRVPNAYWQPRPDRRGARFCWVHPGIGNQAARFRRSVGGNVPKA